MHFGIKMRSNKSVLNCISEQEEGNKKIRQVHKLTQTDPF